MVLRKFQQKSIKKGIDRSIIKNNISTLNAPLRTLGVIVNSDEFRDQEKFYELAKELGLQRKDVKIITFEYLKKKAPSLKNNIVTNKDFNIRGAITNNNVLEFLDREYDAVIGYYSIENQYLDSLMAKVKSKFSIGIKGMDDRLFDLILSVNASDFESFKKELIKYFTILKYIK